ncbi:hypothetical protein [Streptomyces sp. NPDC054865]
MDTTSAAPLLLRGPLAGLGLEAEPEVRGWERSGHPNRPKAWTP